MRRTLASLAALVALGAQTRADEVFAGDTYTLNGVTVTTTMTLNPLANTVDVTFHSGGDASLTVTGTPGENASASKPSAVDAGPDDGALAGGERFRIRDGTMEKKNDECEWIDMGRPRKSGKVRRARSETLQVGDLAPWAGWFEPFDSTAMPEGPVPRGWTATASGTLWRDIPRPGDEVTTLPDPGDEELVASDPSRAQPLSRR